MLTQKQIKFIKMTANIYRKIHAKYGGKAMAIRYKQDYECNLIPVELAVPIVSITDVYIAIQEQKITKEEGIEKQKSIFKVFEIEREEVQNVN